MFGSKNSKRIGFSECHERNMPRTFKNRLNVTIEELVNLHIVVRKASLRER